jgi:glycosyltransferase involved in cell wall biosynthesis
MTNRYTFTVFTPTYNRAATLPRVWTSLMNQTFLDFEWLIVDDGSTDDTREVVRQWIDSSRFAVRYLYQEHAHKKAAFNRGVQEARGRLFLTLDSDDECIATALERLLWHWNNIPSEEQKQYSAVTGLCAYSDGTMVGSRFPNGEYLDSTPAEITRRWKVKGDKWGFQRTDVLCSYEYPEVSGHVPEGIVWCRIGEKYRTRYINEILLIVHQDGAGAGRLSASRDHARVAPGMRLWMEEVLGRQWSYFREDPFYFARCAVNFTRFGLHARRLGLSSAAGLPGRWLVIALFPAGCVAYLADLWKLRPPRNQL